jgi:uncharacterized protein
MTEADKIINLLKLTAHPEGGYYREIYRSKDEMSLTGGVARNLSTSIYYLIRGNQVSAFHRLKSDELWYYHLGCPLQVYFFDSTGYSSHILGPDIVSGQQVQLIIPAGTIFGAELADKSSFCLFGCMVSPGFDFTDFELIPEHHLINEYPKYETIIKRLINKT